MTLAACTRSVFGLGMLTEGSCLLPGHVMKKLGRKQKHVGAFRWAHALIAPAERLASDQYEIDLIGLGIDGPAHALLLQGQRAVPGWL